MKIKEIIKYAFKKTRREKRNIYFIAVLIMCTMVSIGTLTFRNMYFEKLERSIINDPLYRSITLGPDKGDYFKDMENYQFDVEQILNVNHVVDAYDMRYFSYIYEVEEFKNLGYDGNVEFVYGSEYMLPNDIIGEKFSENDTGVAICSNNFYPDNSKVELFSQGDIFIDENELLNTTFQINEDIYRRVDGEYVTTGEKYTKEFKIIGVFDSNASEESLGTCYLSPRDMQDIYNSLKSDLNPDLLYSYAVVVDEQANLSDVVDEFKNLGYRVSLQTQLNYEYINTIQLVCNLLITVCIVVTIIMTVGYIKKKVMNNAFEIGLLKSFGYKRYVIEMINIFQVLCLSFSGFVIGVVLFEVLILFINIFFKNYLIFKHIEITQNIINIIIPGIIICFISMVITYVMVWIAMKKNAIGILKSDQT